MRWNIIVECVGEDGEQSTITLGTIERLAGLRKTSECQLSCRSTGRDDSAAWSESRGQSGVRSQYTAEPARRYL